MPSLPPLGFSEAAVTPAFFVAFSSLTRKALMRGWWAGQSLTGRTVWLPGVYRPKRQPGENEDWGEAASLARVRQPGEGVGRLRR